MRSLFGNLHTPSSLSPLSGQAPGRHARGSGGFWSVMCLLAGALHAAALAWPFGGLQALSVFGLVPGVPNGGLHIASLGVLVLALRQVQRVGQVVWRTWVFALAWMLGSFWWLFISMHTYGGLAAWLAVLAVLALAAALALIFALALGVLGLLAPRARWFQALLFAALWTLAELARGQWFTGFPWGAGGYAQVDLMRGWAPWVGVYGMGAIAALLAYALALACSALPAAAQALVARRKVRAAPPSGRPVVVQQPLSWLAWPARGVLLALLASLLLQAELLAAGQAQLAPTGALRVWLLQGNIAQDEKFVAGTGVAQALEWYPQQLAEAAAAPRDQRPQLVVAPETAVPVLPAQLNGAFWRPLMGTLAGGASATPNSEPAMAALFGLPLGSYTEAYTNSVWGVTPSTAHTALGLMGTGDQGTAPPDNHFYRYDKHHLVPFGEFIPPLARWFIDLMNIPLGDFARGGLVQPPLGWAGQRIAPNICYEDLFGEELAASFINADTAPTVLVNLSNIGWFGDTVAIDQHLQISRLRALELGRPMLRATNTGATAAIDHQGRITHQLQRLTRARLPATVLGQSGLTPYARWAGSWGLWPAWGVGLGIVAWAALARVLARRRA